MSVYDIFFTMFLLSYHQKFSGVITIDKNDVRAKFQGQRSEGKVTEVKTNFAPNLAISGIRIVTQAWIHQWLWNDAQSLK